MVGSVCNTTTIACLLVAAYVGWCSLGIHRVVRCVRAYMRALEEGWFVLPPGRRPAHPESFTSNATPPISPNPHIPTQMYPLQYLPPLEPGTPTLDPLWAAGRGFDVLCYLR